MTALIKLLRHLVFSAFLLGIVVAAVVTFVLLNDKDLQIGLSLAAAAGVVVVPSVVYVIFPSLFKGRASKDNDQDTS